MLRSTYILVFVILTGCVTPLSKAKYWEEQRAFMKAEQKRLNEIYRAAFLSAFLEGWSGGSSIHCQESDLVDPDGQNAREDGFLEGLLEGRKARMSRILKSEEQEAK